MKTNKEISMEVKRRLKIETVEVGRLVDSAIDIVLGILRDEGYLGLMDFSEVLKLHLPIGPPKGSSRVSGGAEPRCAECSWDAVWPCETVLAVPYSVRSSFFAYLPGPLFSRLGP